MVFLQSFFGETCTNMLGQESLQRPGLFGECLVKKDIQEDELLKRLFSDACHPEKRYMRIMPYVQHDIEAGHALSPEKASEKDTFIVTYRKVRSRDSRRNGKGQ